MLKTLFCRAAVIGALTLSSTAFGAGITGQLEVSDALILTSSPNLTSHAKKADLLLTVSEEGRKIGVSAMKTDEWGEDATYAGVRWVEPMGRDLWFDVTLSGSDHGMTLPSRRISAMLQKRFTDENLIVGAGVDVFNMRDGSQGRAIRLEGVHYVQGLDRLLAIQADMSLYPGSGERKLAAGLGMAATYGTPGSWTVMGRIARSRVAYDLTGFPGQAMDYYSTSATAQVRYWVGPDWGLSGEVVDIRNKYYHRQEFRAGAFWNFCENKTPC